MHTRETSDFWRLHENINWVFPLNNLKTDQCRSNLTANKNEFQTFDEFQQDEIIKIIKELPKNKASTLKDIPVKIMANSVHVYSHALVRVFNDCAKSEKGDTTNKSNYRPISTFSNFSEVFQKSIYTQINSFMEPKLSRYPVDFRKNHNTQHALVKMIEIWDSMLNKYNKVGATVTNLSKSFDTNTKEQK